MMERDGSDGKIGFIVVREIGCAVIIMQETG